MIAISKATWNNTHVHDLTPDPCFLVVFVPPLVHQILSRLGPSWELKLEARIEQAPGNYAAALEHQFRLGAHEECADLKQRCRSGEAVRHVPRVAQRGHEFAIGQRIRAMRC